MHFKQLLGVVAISAGTAIGSVWAYNRFIDTKPYIYSQGNDKMPVNYAGFFDKMDGSTAGPADFTAAAAAAIPATVHITTKSTIQVTPRRSPFSDMFPDLDDFFGGPGAPRSVPQQASGSGAIISEDGYIVTNNHVVDGANEMTVTLSNKKTFKAKLIAADPSSDLALIKVEAKGLPFLVYGNSDEVKIGQWVLAVGYPLTLETTVTAGIVSAKGRTLDINRRQSQTPVESFIQTDAAVNPGNSGGPLINTEGQLIGINSAIASPTGSYAGYSFTIPVNIVKKIVNDIMKFGTPQRAFLGIQYPKDGLNEEQKKEQGIKDGEGVYVMEVTANGAAADAGIKKGDFITKIDNVPVYSGADLVAQIALHSPGNKITVSYMRDGKERTASITLRNSSGNTDIVKTSALDKLGAELVTLTKEQAKSLGIKGGVLVKSIGANGLLSKVRIQEGYIIIRANGKDVISTDDLRKIMESASGSIKMEGIYEGYEGTYPIVINLKD
ncbi:MAG TPA: trypsin-like peptidase domain-containing protein [Chitinophagaceae bacterium]|nr:trypsin-like peptidase domain-containing protein [Chitinophagaceae bacterium]